jgi:DUF1009 family protein
MSSLLVLSGRGELPQIFKKLAAQKGYKTYTVGVKGITDRETDFKIPFLGFEELKELIRRLNKPKLVMLGKFDQRIPFLLSSSVLFRLKILLGLKNAQKNHEIFEKILKLAPDGQPASLIRAFIRYMEGEGFQFLSSPEVKKILSPLFAGEGNLTPQVKFQITQPLLDIFKKTKTIADMDIGQTLVVKNNTVIAVEGIEGTDNLLKRSCKLAGRGFIAIKVARTDQDYRIDIPTVGLETLKILKKCGAKALLLEANKVLIVQKGRFLKEAQRANLAVIGLTPRWPS